MTSSTLPRLRVRAPWRSSIPRDVYDHVYSLALAVVNASAKGNCESVRKGYQELEIYCQSLEASGRRHPFLLETLADFGESASVSIRLDHSALRLARRMGEQQHTILLSLARVHLELGHLRSARRSLLAAHSNAVEYRDHEDAVEAERLLQRTRKPRPPNPALQRTRFARR